MSDDLNDDEIYFHKDCGCFRKQRTERMLGKFAGIELKAIVPRGTKQDIILKTILADSEKPRIFYGKPGTGKTHFMAGVFNHIAEKNFMEMTWYSARGLMSSLRNAELNEDGAIFYMQSIFQKCKYFFIDDIDKIKPTEFNLDMLFDFMDAVDKQKVNLYLTTNLTMQELATHFTSGTNASYGASIVRRIDISCRLVDFNN
jgi:DNA replication protein DnaC